jgi:hypothetical protein
MQPNNVPLRFVLVPLGLFLGLLALPNLLGPRVEPEPSVQEPAAPVQDAGDRMEASVAQLAAAYAAVRR